MIRNNLKTIRTINVTNNKIIRRRAKTYLTVKIIRRREKENNFIIKRVAKIKGNWRIR